MKRKEGAVAGGFIEEGSVREGVGFEERRHRSMARDRAMLTEVFCQRKRKGLTGGPGVSARERRGVITVLV
jgi:hypothetical protein